MRLSMISIIIQTEVNVICRSEAEADNIDRGLNNISYWILLSPIWQNTKSRLQYWARPKVEPNIEVET